MKQLTGISLLLLAGAAIDASAVVFSTNINFNEAAFPTGTTNVSGTTQSYNVLDDTLGTELVTLNGDATDIDLSFSSSGVDSNWAYQTTSLGRFTGSNSFTNTPASNNEGTIKSNSVTLAFASHLTVTDLSFDVLSTNTNGVTWEYTIFEFLDASGTPFSSYSITDPYLTHTSVNGAPIGTTGIYVLDVKDTVTAATVGTNLVTAGSHSPTNENFTITDDLNYSDVGLAPGTVVGGLRMTTYLEDVRGINNASSSLTSSLIDFTFSGEINPVPETSSYAFIFGTLSGLFIFCRRQ